jgi:tRNA dimethylallyltransferase
VSAPSDLDVSDLRTTAIEQMKSHTRQYVLRQLAWINHKLIPLCSRTNTPVYILDATDPSKWSDRVLAPALRVANAFLKEEPLPRPSEISERADELMNITRQTSHPDSWRRWVCEVCYDKETGDPFILVGGEKEWNQHLTSRRHKSREKGRRKRDRYEEWLAKQTEKEMEEEYREFGV